MRSLLAFVLLFGCTNESEEMVPGEPIATSPSVLLVVLDSLRADSLSLYGNTRSVPQLEAIADAGVVFYDVTSPGSWTWPAHAALFTGLPPWESGARHNPNPSRLESTNRADIVLPMRTDRPTIAEQLGRAGYGSIALSANGWLHPDLGLTRGFSSVSHLPRDIDVTTQAESVITAAGEEPLFLFLNYMGAHAPYTLAPDPSTDAHIRAQLTGTDRAEWLEPYLMSQPLGLDLYRIPEGTEHSGFTSFMRGDLEIPEEGLALLRALYESEAWVLDQHLARVLTAWTQRYPDGVVIVTSDHGEFLGEYQLLEHGLMALPEVLQVPLIIAAPGRIQAKQRVTTPVQLHDIAGTILELAGIKSPTPSLLPVIAGEPRAGAIQAAAWHHPTSAASMGGRFQHDWTWWREDEWALVQNSAGESQLYDLSTDPDLSRDLALVHPQLYQEMLERSREGWPLHTSDATLTVPDDVQEELRALGYMH